MVVVEFFFFGGERGSRFSIVRFLVETSVACTCVDAQAGERRESAVDESILCYINATSYLQIDAISK